MELAVSNTNDRMHTAVVRPHHCRSAVAYSCQTFPWTDYLSVCLYVRASVGLSSRIVEKGQIGSGCRVGRTGPGMTQVVGFGNRSTGRGTFGGRICGTPL